MRWGRVLPGAGVVMLLASGVSGQTRDIDGRSIAPSRPGKASVLLFVQTDCPVSNSYAPELQRICKAYGSKGVSCSLAYEDVRIDTAAVRKHMKDFAYSGVTATIDSVAGAGRSRSRDDHAAGRRRRRARHRALSRPHRQLLCVPRETTPARHRARSDRRARCRPRRQACAQTGNRSARLLHHAASAAQE